MQHNKHIQSDNLKWNLIVDDYIYCHLEQLNR